MEKIKIIVDSLSNITKEVADKNDIGVFSFKLLLDDKTYNDMVDIGREEFFDKLIEAKEAHTSIPSPEEFKTFIKDFIDQGYNKFLIYSTSSGISGMYQLMKINSQEIEEDYGVEIEVIDTKIGHFAVVFATLELKEMIDKAASFEEVKTRAYKNLEKMKVHLILRSLDYLIKGGRVPKALAANSESEAMYPVITLEDGLLVLEKKDIGKARSLRSFIGLIKEEAAMYDRYCLGITHGKDLKEFEKVKAQVQDEIDGAEIYLEDALSSSTATHLGPDSLVFTVYPLD
ncbi:MAG: DegV family protein [Finegoldia sp.]|nr:DegV family protein [Finegoldia sp.]